MLLALSGAPVFHQAVPTFVHDALEFAYETMGDPELPAVVLLHGFTSDLRMWHPVAEELARRYYVVMLDLRGHGRSAAPGDLEAYTADALAGDVLAMLDHLKLEVCALVGSSFGGMLALQFAATWPERLAALAVSDAGAAYAHPRYDERYWQRECSIDASTEVIRKFGTAELGRRAGLALSDPFLARGIRDRYTRLSADGWLGCARVRKERPDLLPVLRSRLTLPVMVAYGEDDPVRCAAEVLADELPGARVVMVRGAGHGLPVVAPHTYARELLRFLEDVEEGRDVAARRTAG